MTHTTDLCEWLSRFYWLECPLILKNTSAKKYAEHPLLILDALFKYASHCISEAPWPMWFFRPEAQFKHPVVEGALYKVALIFPNTDVSFGASAIEAVKIQLAAKNSHFVLEYAGTPCERTLESIPRQSYSDAQTHSLCLQIRSPLPLKNNLKGEIHSGVWLIEQFIRRVERLFEATIPEVLRRECFLEASDIHPNPWFLRRHVFTHKSRSTNGTRFLDGHIGPIFLEGCSEYLLPLLQFCASLNFGSRLSAGQGAFSLHIDSSSLDRRLDNDFFLQNVWNAFCSNMPEEYDDSGDSGDTMGGISEYVRSLLADCQQAPPRTPPNAGKVLFTSLLLHALLYEALHSYDPSLANEWCVTYPRVPEAISFFTALLSLIPHTDVKTRSLVRFLALSCESRSFDRRPDIES